jgi:enamine deaminase RidA (YjgF/YER057c/UK114 family)
MTRVSTKENQVTVQRIDVGARLSKVVVHGDTVYVAGLTADKTAGQSVAAQTQEILAAIDALLAKAGSDNSKLVQATIWLQNVRTVDEMNKVWDAWVPSGCAPVRACIEARLQSPAKMVEIGVTAAK